MLYYRSYLVRRGHNRVVFEVSESVLYSYS